MRKVRRRKEESWKKISRVNLFLKSMFIIGFINMLL